MPTRRGLAARLALRAAAVRMSSQMAYAQRAVREFIGTMPRMGVTPGRTLPPLDNMLHVTIGADAELTKFRDVFWKVRKG